MIRVRFAPSPTGYLHIGGARTALFNWMYAASQQGKFILRIEDTDTGRSKKEFLDEILNSMQWLGLKWDELYRQSERFDIYGQYAKKLLEAGSAYKDGNAVILRIPKEEVIIYDIIRGEIHFDTETIKDQVLIKSDGSPTYSFACVVDDALMEISHVIRGEDHISNTPKQIMIYKSLGLKIPKWAHLPLITDADGARMSKRTGAVAVSEYRAMGFVPDALVNYLMLLGWSPGGNQEIIEIKDAVKKFSIKKINKTAAAFSFEKLKWVNGQHLKKMNTANVTDLLIPLLRDKGYIKDEFDRKRLETIVKLYQSRMPTLVDFLGRTKYLFVDEIQIDPQARQEYLAADHSKTFELLSQNLDLLDIFDIRSTEDVFRKIVSELNIESSELVHPVRVALTGMTVGIGLFETMAVLGKKKTVQRLRNVYK